MGADVLTFMKDLQARIASHLQKAGLDEAAARERAQEIFLEVAEEWGGISVYIPKGQEAIIEARDREIFRRLSAGESAFRLSQEFGVTERRVWQIGQTYGNREFDRRQTAFPFPARH